MDVMFCFGLFVCVWDVFDFTNYDPIGFFFLASFADSSTSFVLPWLALP